MEGDTEVRQSEESLLETRADIDTLMDANRVEESSNSRAEPTNTNKRMLSSTSKEKSTK